MSAYQFNLDTIANNLANTGTTAFKSSRANFEDSFYEYFKLPGAQDSSGKGTPIGIAVGTGVKVAGTELNFDQGGLIDTGQPLDIAIEGDGFFQVTDSSEVLYTRNGAFSINSEGEIVLATASKSWVLDPSISIPADAMNISISKDGIVEVQQPGVAEATQLGQIQTAKFVNPQGLVQRGDSMYAESAASGSPQVGNPNIEGRGGVQQGRLEISNVNAVNELVDLIKTQRYFELSSQAVQAADQMLQQIANLRRF